MAWLYVLIAGIFEVVWAMGMKYSEGFTRIYPSLITVVGMFISFYFLSIAVKTLPIGTAYAVWTGIGTLGAIIFGCVFLKEPITISRVMFTVMLLIGILGLKITVGNH